MLKNNINFQVLPWPSLVSNLKVSVPYHFMSQMNKTCITQLKCNIFTWMPYLTWSWPIAKQRAFTSMVGTFFIAWEAFWKVLFAGGPSFVTNKAKGTILNFNPWPDHDLTLVTFLRTSDKFSLMDFDSPFSTSLWPLVPEFSRRTESAPSPLHLGAFGWLTRQAVKLQWQFSMV